MANSKNAYIVGGPNGAGKSTFVDKYLPKYVEVKNFVNADLIASGLSRFDYSTMQIKAGKIMLGLIKDYKNKGLSFGFETTLAGKKWIDLINDLKKQGYTINIFFLDMISIELALKRIQFRIESGGHGIPKDTVKRRYVRSRYNFWHKYKNVANNWYLFNNSYETPELIAFSENNREIVQNKKYYNFFLNSVKT